MKVENRREHRSRYLLFLHLQDTRRGRSIGDADSKVEMANENCNIRSEKGFHVLEYGRLD